MDILQAMQANLFLPPAGQSVILSHGVARHYVSVQYCLGIPLYFWVASVLWQ